jgi:hypothetical protein
MNIHCKHCSHQINHLDEVCLQCGKNDFVYDQEMAEIEAYEEEMAFSYWRYLYRLHPDDITNQLKAATWRTDQDGITVINEQTGRKIATPNEPSLIVEIEKATDSLLLHISQTNNDLILDILDNLNDKVAAALGKNKWSVLSLNGLRNLTPTTAQALADRKGPTHLNGLTTLDNAIASILATYQAITLSLDGLKSIDSATAEILARYPNCLSLNGLTAIDEATAEALAHNKGHLSLEGIRTPSPHILAELARHKGRTITIGKNSRTKQSISGMVENRTPQFEHLTEINGLDTLTPSVIDILSLPEGHKGEITIRGLSEITKEQAQALTAHDWDITLDCVHSVTDETAKILSKHKGAALKLKQLNHIDTQLAKTIAEYRGYLGLNSIAFIDDVVAIELGKHRGTGLNLDSLCNLNATQARALSTHKGVLSLYGLTTLDEDAAAGLSNHTSELYLDGILKLNDAAALALSKHKGMRLSLRELTEISRKARTALMTHTRVIIPNY